MQMYNDRMEMHLEEMRALTDQLHATRDPAERRRLLIEHRMQMAEMMGMMGGGPKGGAPMPEGEKRRQYMIEKRLDTMDHMMEMMMRRDEMMMDR